MLGQQADLVCDDRIVLIREPNGFALQAFHVAVRRFPGLNGAGSRQLSRFDSLRVGLFS